jgi:hypothetical protein
MALRELGLPYAQDPAVTRHLAAFLRAHAAAGFAALGIADPPRGALPRPDAILLNGGVFNSPKIAERLVAVLSSWWPDAPPIRLLQHDSLELAVARGAAYYGLARRGLGQRIGGGAAHAIYVGLAPDKETGQPRAACLIPRGQEEGQTVELDSRPFTLTLGRPVQFPLYSTASDRGNIPGDIVPITEENFRPLPPIHTLFKSASIKTATAPVHLRATLTELGTLELWCVSVASKERWRLELELRQNAESNRGAATVTESMPPKFAEACAVVDRVFGKQPQAVDPRDVRNLFRTLEKTIGARETWRLPLLRELWSVLIAGAKHRRRSLDHERVYLQLIGYTLRPGFGYPLDEWRCEQTFKLFAESVKFHKEAPIWNEFWVLWRRIAGGLNEARQNELWAYLKPWLAKRIAGEPAKTSEKSTGISPQGLDEMVRVAASLEHLDPAEKQLLGNWITARLSHSGINGGPWVWALGRLGARVLIYGSSHKTVPASQAEEWIERLLGLGLNRVENAAFAVAQLARLTPDRALNLDPALQTRVQSAMDEIDAPAPWRKMVREISVMEAADEARALGDTLPIGLQPK